MTNLINFYFNGQFYTVSKPITLLELLIYFNYQPSLLVIEYNKSICNKENWSKIIIQMNDKIEAVSIVGGG